MPSNHLILCCPLLLLPPIPPSIRVFSNESALRMRWLKYWSFSFSISPSNEHPGLISFRMDWLSRLLLLKTGDYVIHPPNIAWGMFQAQVPALVGLNMSGVSTELVLWDRALCSFNLPSGSGKGVFISGGAWCGWVGAYHPLGKKSNCCKWFSVFLRMSRNSGVLTNSSSWK